MNNLTKILAFFNNDIQVDEHDVKYLTLKLASVNYQIAQARWNDFDPEKYDPQVEIDKWAERVFEALDVFYKDELTEIFKQDQKLYEFLAKEQPFSEKIQLFNQQKRSMVIELDLVATLLKYTPAELRAYFDERPYLEQSMRLYEFRHHIPNKKE